MLKIQQNQDKQLISYLMCCKSYCTMCTFIFNLSQTCQLIRIIKIVSFDCLSGRIKNVLKSGFHLNGYSCISTFCCGAECEHFNDAYRNILECLRK